MKRAADRKLTKAQREQGRLYLAGPNGRFARVGGFANPNDIATIVMIWLEQYADEDGGDDPDWGDVLEGLIYEYP